MKTITKNAQKRKENTQITHKRKHIERNNKDQSNKEQTWHDDDDDDDDDDNNNNNNNNNRSCIDSV